LAFEGIDDLIMSGILYSNQDSIKDDFQENLLNLAKFHTAVDQSESALGFMLRIQSSNFERTGEYPCKHFFALFNELIELHYTKQGNSLSTVVFDAEKLLF
jgi:hypothetical protein